MNTLLKIQVERISETVTHAGQAIYAIAQLMDEDQIRRDSGDSTEFLKTFEKGCLLNGLKVLAEVLWEKGRDIEQLADDAREVRS